MNLGHRTEAEHHHQQCDHAGDDQVRHEQRGVAGVGLAGLGKNKTARQDRADDPADGVAALAEIDPGDARLGRPEHGGVRIGDGFQKRQPANRARTVRRETPQISPLADAWIRVTGTNSRHPPMTTSSPVRMPAL